MSFQYTLLRPYSTMPLQENTTIITAMISKKGFQRIEGFIKSYDSFLARKRKREQRYFLSDSESARWLMSKIIECMIDVIIQCTDLVNINISGWISTLLFNKILRYTTIRMLPVSLLCTLFIRHARARSYIKHGATI